MPGRTFLALALSLVCALPAYAADPKRPANRLAKEKSPYLRQHAHNPVDWYPWGPEAFEKARKENKPIFLSVGYSTCHWCHVMERESFANDEVAKLLNDKFVPVKVDREERPDVDRTYMTYVVAAHGSGGWPMTVFLTPDLKPFYGGTYYPPEDRAGMVGIKTLLTRVHEAWEAQREKIVESSEQISAELKKFTHLKPAEGDGSAVDAALLDTSFQALLATYDEQFGGFGRAPKFPEPVNFNFLLHYSHRAGDPALKARARQMVLRTLKAIADGGIHDHLGGGFHRYSTDRRWFLPHFEKMLYDQAQLASCYLDGYQLTRDQAYADVARKTLDYVLRDLTGPGQFYSAEDADSARDAAKPEEKAEGAFYVWRADEVAKVLGADAAAVVSFHFELVDAGNVPKAQDPHQEFTAQNVLSVVKGVDETAKQFGKTPEQVRQLLEDARKKLFDARGTRPRPHRDDKTIVAWNGLMISAFARAGVVLEEPRYTEAAVRAATFIRDRLYSADGRTLRRIWRDGPADVEGFLDDYAFYTQALLDLYETTLDARWLKLATELQATQDKLFEDPQDGGYFDTPTGDVPGVTRMKGDHEGVEPAANSVVALNLLRQSQMTDEAAMEEKARRIFRVYSGRLRQNPGAMAQMLVAVDFSLSKPRQIVIAGDPASADVKAMLREVHRHHLPNRVILGADSGEGQAFLAGHAEFIKAMGMKDGRATAYVCQNYTCQAPTNDLAVLRRQLTDAP